MIYVDMDGVLANLYDYMSKRIFQKTYKSLSSLKKDTLKAVWKNRKGFDMLFPEGPEQMFMNLEPYPFNQILIETIVKIGGEYTILSRPSSMDHEGTIRSKIKWVDKHLSFCPPRETLLVQDKTANGRAAGNVLIDDFAPFLDMWREKKGTAIEYKAWTFATKESVREYIEEKLLNHIK